MTALFIVLTVILLLLIILILPVTADLSYKNELSYRFKYAGITLFNSEKRVNIKKVKRKKKSKKQSGEQPSAEKEGKKENFFKKIYDKKGFFGTVKYCANLLGIILKRLWRVIKRFKFRHFCLDLTVASQDSADTAIEYGGICCAVYPVLSLLESTADFKMKQININADFNKTQPEFQISFSVTTRLIYWITAAISAITEYYKLQRRECENNE